LELWLGGGKPVILFEEALFKTLAMYGYILSTCVLFLNNFENPEIILR